MTINDKLFLEKVQRVSQNNRENDTKKAIATSSGLISDELLGMFGVKKEHKGGWFLNVYVEFENMFKEKQAEEWQQ